MEDAPAIGIDLGTTNSCVAVFQHGKVDIIPNNEGNRTTPSYVAFTDRNERLVGDPAKDQATRYLENTVFDAKRLIGRKFNDDIVQNDMKQWPFKVINDNSKPKIQVEVEGTTKTFFPEEISAIILKKLKESAEAYLGKPVLKAVITVPAYFNDAQRQATKDAATIAGLFVLRIINEPTAAAIAYGLEEKSADKRNVLIFDLGGGTLDVSILTINNGIFEVKSTAGDTHLGGEDFDNKMVNHFTEVFNFKYSTDLTRNKKAMRRLTNACERAKRNLSSIQKATIDIDCLHGGHDFLTYIRRDQFEELNADLFEKTMKLVKKAIRDANMDKTMIQDVVLVGGSSRIPKIQTLLQEFFEGKELHKSIDPDEAVAYGAAIQAAILDGDEAEEIQDILLLDVTPLSLGIGIKENSNKMAVVIERNSTIPAKKTKLFSTRVDYQSRITFRVYEGDCNETKNNSLLGEFILSGIPPALANEPNIDVTFDIDANGILNVSAVDRSTGNENRITIAYNQNRLSENQIERMAKEAEEYRMKEETRSSKENVKSYCINIRNILENENLTDQIKKSDKTMILEKCSETIQWLELNQSFNKDELEAKQKEFKDLFNLTTTLASHPDEKKGKYFEILNVSDGASASEIENAFRKVALKYHPDKCLHDKNIGKLMFLTLSNAKNFLLNQVKRRKQ